MRIQVSQVPWSCELGHIVPKSWPQSAPLRLPTAKGALHTYTCTPSLHHVTLTLPSALNSSQPLGQPPGLHSVHACRAAHPLEESRPMEKSVRGVKVGEGSSC